jgi:lipopolysaccharide export system protein LptA
MLSSARLFLCLALLIAAGPAFAQTPSIGSKNKAPVEITANDAIEWLRNEHLYRASGAAIAKQGDVTIAADTLEASYDPALGEQNIQTVTAIGHVTITSTEHTVVADRGVYNVTTGLVTLTGGAIRLTAPNMTVTAQDKLTYSRSENKASAFGNAVVTTPGRTLKAQQIEAWFMNGSDKKQNSQMGNLQRAAARGNVMIKTDKEILQAQSADYNAVTQDAVMVGNVRLTQGQNHLQGERAVVNMQTGISQLFGSANPNSVGTASGNGRVRALFFPGSDGKSPLAPTAQGTETMIPLRPRTTGETP